MKIQKWLKLGAKSLAILASAFLAFGAMGCSNDGGSNDKKDETVKNDPSGIDVPALEVTDTYSLSAGTLTEAYEDASLYIKFDATPTINASVSVKGDESKNKAVKILKSDGTVVDTIYASAEQITSQATKADYQTINVKDQLISVNGNVVVIKPHTSLDPSTVYYVTVDDGLLSGKVSGATFAGISDKTAFAFTTRAAPSISGNTITIGKDKNFSKIQSAFDYLADKSGDWTLEIDKGYYNERLSFANKNVNVTMIGVGETEGDLGANTVIYWKNNNGKDGSTTNDGWNPASRTRTAFLYEGGNLTIKHLTFANTISRTAVGKDGTQAEAFYYDATGYLVAYDSSFKSHQDTLLLGNSGGRGWFYKCYIEGDTDFIWGYPDTVLFEECQIRCLYDYAPAVTNHTSYIFASRSIHTANANKGLVLFNSSITVDNGVTAYYGRNSGSDTQAAVVFNKFSTIDKALWYAGSTKYDEDVEGVCSVGYKDYGNTYSNGSVIDTSSRKEGCYGLSKEVAEREFCGRNAILNRGWDATNRVYKACTTQWDLSALETEFGASEDASKKMIYVEPTYVPYLEGKSSTDFTFTDYAGKALSDVTLTSGDESVATVSGTTVTAVENQTSLITVTASFGDMSGVTRINVIPQVIEATELALTYNGSDAAFEIDKDDKVTLNAVFTPAETTDQSITWTSSDTNVLRVTGSGALGNGLDATVTGFGLGTATITATSTKTPSVSKSIEITVKEVYAARYLQESTGYTLAASVDHRDATIAAEPVSYGFAGGVELAELSDADKAWGNNGYKFTSNADVTPDAGGDICWADFKIRAAGAIKIKAITADAYCSATSNLRGIVYTKVGDGEFTKKAEVAAESKAMSFDKEDISTDVAATQTVTVRVAIALLEGKTVSKAITGVIGGVVIYYDIEGTPVAFPGADGDYNIIDYATAAEKTSQGTAIADGSSADGMVSWHNVTYHSDGYGLQILGTTGATITIKVGGPSVISMVSSVYSAGTITVTNSSGDVIASGSTKVATDKTPFSFLYTESGEDTLTVAFTGSTSYIGKINVKELTTEVAEVTSVKINGAETVSTAAPVKFTAAVEATYMASPEVTWSSGDETTATVAEDGTVTGVKAGEVTITATSKFDTTKSDTVTVTITEEELKPVVGVTYSYNFLGTAITTKVTPDMITATSKTAGTSSDTFCSWNEKWNTHNYGLSAGAGASISIKVAGNVIISWAGSKSYGNAVIDVTYGDENTALLTGVSGLSGGEKIYNDGFIYKGDATTITISVASGTMYLSELLVTPWTDEVPAVTAISVKGNAEVALSEGTSAYTADVTGTYFVDESITWSVENGTGSATIDSSTGVLTVTSAGTVTVKATSVATPSVNGSKVVTVTETASVKTTFTFNTNQSGTEWASDQDSNVKITSESSLTTNATYGINGTLSLTIPVPNSCAQTVIAYVSYGPGTLELKDEDTSYGSFTTTTNNDNPKGPVPVIFRYTGNGSKALTLATSGVYLLEVIIDTNELPASVSSVTYDFTTEDNYSFPVGVVEGTNNLYYYSDGSKFYSTQYGIQTYDGKANKGFYMSFAVGGACKVTATLTANDGAFYLYDINNTIAQYCTDKTALATVDGKDASNKAVLTYSETTPTVLTLFVPHNVYISTIAIDPVE